MAGCAVRFNVVNTRKPFKLGQRKSLSASCNGGSIVEYFKNVSRRRSDGDKPNSSVTDANQSGSTARKYRH